MPVPTQEHIKKDVVDQLFWDSRVDASDVAVEVQDGTVVLQGTVPTFLARRAALSDAWSVMGVSDVEDQLSVRYPTTVTLPDDEQVRANVQTALGWWPEIDATRIHPTVENGIVTLEGSVDALWKKMHAEEIVLNLTGVLGVNNRLTVVPTKEFTDQAIAEDIMAAFDRNLLINPDTVIVQVEGGVATLSGAVPTPAVRQAAYETAIYTSGVVAVRDELRVAEAPA